MQALSATVSRAASAIPAPVAEIEHDFLTDFFSKRHTGQNGLAVVGARQRLAKRVGARRLRRYGDDAGHA